MSTENEHAGSDCGEGCEGFQPLPGNPWNDYGLCRKPDSPIHGFPVRRGVSCRNYSPRGPVPDEPLLKPNGADADSASH